jgi:CzcA family heavy metal efflux pump
MLRHVVSSALKFKLLLVAAAAALLLVGANQLRKAPVEVLPDFTPTTVEVQTEALGLSASEVEQLITVPLEQDLLNGVAFLKDIRSQSVPGLSRILMIFDPGTDVFKARQVVAERLTQAHALPQVSKPPLMLQPLSSTDRVMLVGMSSGSVSPLEMGVLARWTIAPRLVGVPGVANVSVWGQQDRQLQVQVDPERLRQQGVRLNQVIETSANALWVSPLTFVEASTPGTGGFVDTPNQRLGIQHESPITTPADLAKVRVEGTNGRKLVLGDVANVVEDHQPLIGDAVLQGSPGLLLVVQRFPGSNLLDVTRGVEKAIDEMKPGLPGIEFGTSVYRPATYIGTSIDNVKVAVLIGLGLLALALLAFFFRWRAALIGIVVVPLSVLAAALVLWAFGSTINAIVVAGLAAAVLLVIDDAIVNIDSTSRRIRDERRKGIATTPAETCVEAALEVRRPLTYATLIIALAALPLFFFNRLSGAFFPDMAAAFLVALLASMVIALTVTPALSALLFSRARMNGDGSRLAGWLHARYGAGLSRMLPRPRMAYLALGGLLALAGATAPFLGQSLLPTLKENDVLVSWDSPPGTSLPEMTRITALAARELRSLPGVSDVGAHVGRAVTGDQVVGVNSGELWVSIDPGADYGATLASIRRVVGGYPGFSHDVQTYSQERVSQVLSGTNEDVVVRVYGEDLKILAAQAAKVRQAMSSIDGIAGARVLLPAEEPTLQVRVDLAKAERYGIKPGDVRRAATTLLSGLVVGSLFEQQKVFDVVVWGVPQVRNSVTSVRSLLIDTPAGGHVRLGDVAAVSIVPSPGVINRQAVSRYVDVGASVSGRDRDAVVSDVEGTLAGLIFPLEYHAEVLAADTQRTGLLISVAVAAVIGIFLLLQVLFGSWRLATMSMLALPIGAVGALAAVLAAGGKLSFGSYIALLAVFGVGTRSCVLLFDRIRALEQDEGLEFGPELVLRAARERFEPVLTTAVAAGLVSLPVLVMGSRPGLELLNPIAAVFVGGLISSALFSFFVLPVLYLRFGFSRAEAPEAAAEELPAALEELARGATGAAAVTSGIGMSETRAVPDPTGGDRP